MRDLPAHSARDFQNVASPPGTNPRFHRLRDRAYKAPGTPTDSESCPAHVFRQTDRLRYQVKRAAASHRDDSVYLPALAPSWKPFPQIGEIVGEGRHEAMAVIEVGARTLLVDAMAVVGLRRIGDIVLPIRSVVDRVRPCVVDRRAEAVLLAQAEARLQGVVVRIRSRLELVHIEEGPAGRRERPVVERARR